MYIYTKMLCSIKKIIVCLLNTYGSIFYLAREWIKTSVAEMLKLKALVLFFICLQKLHFDIYFALCLHIMISIFDKNAYMFSIFCLSVSVSLSKAW